MSTLLQIDPLQKKLPMKHITCFAMVLTLMVSCQKDDQIAETNIDEIESTTTLNLCEEDIQQDQICVTATNIQNGNTFTKLFLLNDDFKPCFQFFQNSRDTITKDFYSLVRHNSDEEYIHIEFFHGEECDLDGSQTIITLAFARISIENNQLGLGMSHMEFVDSAKLKPYGAVSVEQKARITDLKFLSFSNTVGDFIEGSFISENVRPSNFSFDTGRPFFSSEDDGTRYTVEIKFKLSIEG